MIGNKIADKITSVSKKKSTKESTNYETEVGVERATPKKRYISPEGLLNYWWINVSTKKGIYIFRNYWWIKVNVKKYTYLQKKNNKSLIN